MQIYIFHVLSFLHEILSKNNNIIFVVQNEGKHVSARTVHVWTSLWCGHATIDTDFAKDMS